MASAMLRIGLHNSMKRLFVSEQQLGDRCQYFVTSRSHSHKPSTEAEEKGSNKAESKRMAEFRKKLRETTPIDDLGEQPLKHAAVKDDPLPPWPDNTNPHTGEIGGPRGPEPTRYGDWERKGRVTDF